jgi:hypothetical protein
MWKSIGKWLLKNVVEEVAMPLIAREVEKRLGANRR